MKDRREVLCGSFF